MRAWWDVLRCWFGFHMWGIPRIDIVVHFELVTDGSRAGDQMPLESRYLRCICMRPGCGAASLGVKV